MSTVLPRRIPAIGLLALVPVALFVLLRGAPEVWLSAVCVLLVVASLRLMFAAEGSAAAG